MNFTYNWFAKIERRSIKNAVYFKKSLSKTINLGKDKMQEKAMVLQNEAGKLKCNDNFIRHTKCIFPSILYILMFQWSLIFLEYFLHWYLIYCRRKNNLVLSLYVVVVTIFISISKGGSDENFFKRIYFVKPIVKIHCLILGIKTDG